MAWSEPQMSFRVGARRKTRAEAVSAAASIDMACCIGGGEFTVFRTLDGERVASAPSLDWFSGWEASSSVACAPDGRAVAAAMPERLGVGPSEGVSGEAVGGSSATAHARPWSPVSPWPPAASDPDGAATARWDTLSVADCSGPGVSLALEASLGALQAPMRRGTDPSAFLRFVETRAAEASGAVAAQPGTAPTAEESGGWDRPLDVVAIEAVAAVTGAAPRPETTVVAAVRAATTTPAPTAPRGAVASGASASRTCLGWCAAGSSGPEARPVVLAGALLGGAVPILSLRLCQNEVCGGAKNAKHCAASSEVMALPSLSAVVAVVPWRCQAELLGRRPSAGAAVDTAAAATSAPEGPWAVIAPLSSLQDDAAAALEAGRLLCRARTGVEALAEGTKMAVAMWASFSAEMASLREAVRRAMHRAWAAFRPAQGSDAELEVVVCGPPEAALAEYLLSGAQGMDVQATQRFSSAYSVAGQQALPAQASEALARAAEVLQAGRPSSHPPPHIPVQMPAPSDRSVLGIGTAIREVLDTPAVGGRLLEWRRSLSLAASAVELALADTAVRGAEEAALALGLLGERLAAHEARTGRAVAAPGRAEVTGRAVDPLDTLLAAAQASEPGEATQAVCPPGGLDSRAVWSAVDVLRSSAEALHRARAEARRGSGFADGMLRMLLRAKVLALQEDEEEAQPREPSLAEAEGLAVVFRARLRDTPQLSAQEAAHVIEGLQWAAERKDAAGAAVGSAGVGSRRTATGRAASGASLLPNDVGGALATAAGAASSSAASAVEGLLTGLAANATPPASCLVGVPLAAWPDASPGRAAVATLSPELCRAIGLPGSFGAHGAVEVAMLPCVSPERGVSLSCVAQTDERGGWGVSRTAVSVPEGWAILGTAVWSLGPASNGAPKDSPATVRLVMAMGGTGAASRTLRIAMVPVLPGGPSGSGGRGRAAEWLPGTDGWPAAVAADEVPGALAHDLEGVLPPSADGERPAVALSPAPGRGVLVVLVAGREVFSLDVEVDEEDSDDDGESDSDEGGEDEEGDASDAGTEADAEERNDASEDSD